MKKKKNRLFEVFNKLNETNLDEYLANDYYDSGPGGETVEVEPFNNDQLLKGLSIEMEQYDDPKEALNVAFNNLTEDPYYYDEDNNDDDFET